MQKNEKAKGSPKSNVVHINDYNIKENSKPKKEQFMTIPQKPSKVFD